MASEVEDIARRKSGGGDDGDGQDDEMSSYDDVEDNAANDLMDAFGVPDEKRDDAKAALRDYVKACVEKALDDDKE